MQQSHPTTALPAADLAGSAALGAPTPTSYRTCFSYSGQVPVQHAFERRSYGWYVDLDQLPQVSRWLRPFVGFAAEDHFAGPWDGSLRDRVRSFVTEHGAMPPDGRITALLQAPVAGCGLSLFWCHDRDGTVRQVVVALSTADGGRHACLLPPADVPVLVRGRLCAPRMRTGTSHYLVLAPPPADQVDIVVSSHHEHRLAFTAALRGEPHPVRAWNAAPRLWFQRTKARWSRGAR